MHRNMSLVDLRQKVIRELVLQGHPSLASTLLMEMQPPIFFRDLSAAIMRTTFREGETRDYLELNAANRRIRSPAELVHNFGRLYPNGPDLHMLVMVMKLKDWDLYWRLYQRLVSSLDHKRWLLRQSIDSYIFEVSLQLMQDPEVKPSITFEQYQNALSSYSLLRGDPEVVATLYRLALKAGHRLELTQVKKYLIARNCLDAVARLEELEALE